MNAIGAEVERLNARLTNAKKLKAQSTTAPLTLNLTRRSSSPVCCRIEDPNPDPQALIRGGNDNDDLQALMAKIRGGVDPALAMAQAQTQAQTQDAL